MNTNTRIISFDIETITAPDAEIFKPVFTERLKLDGTLRADSKSIVEQEKEWLDKTALSAKTGQIAMIGYYTPDLYEVFKNGEDYTEKDLINSFYAYVKDFLLQDVYFCGHNIFNFDLPFIVQRGFKYGLKPPTGFRKGRYWHEVFKDTMTAFCCDIYNERISLNNLAKYLGLGEKTETGAEFGKMWNEDKEKAIEYLKKDLELTYLVAERLF